MGVMKIDVECIYEYCEVGLETFEGRGEYLYFSKYLLVFYFVVSVENRNMVKFEFCFYSIYIKKRILRL